MANRTVVNTAVAAQAVTMEEAFWIGGAEVWTFSTPIPSPPKNRISSYNTNYQDQLWFI